MKKNYIKPSIKENIGTVAAYPLIMAAANAAAVGAAAAIKTKMMGSISDKIECNNKEILGLLI